MVSAQRKKSDATITVSGAAEQLELSPHTVRKYCRRGLVGTEYVDPSGRKLYLLRKDEVDWLRHQENRPQNGRPRKSA